MVDRIAFCFYFHAMDKLTTLLAFVWRNHQVLVDSQHKWPVVQSSGGFPDVSLDSFLNK